MKNLIIKTSLAALIVLTANTAMAFEQISSEYGTDSAFLNGGIEKNVIPVASYRAHAGHEIQFSGGAERYNGGNTVSYSDTDHHSNTNNPLSIDFMSKK